jgi:hypothetical protein
MLPTSVLFVGFFAALGCILLGVLGFTYLMPVKVLTLKTDPPPNAHYLLYPSVADGQEVDPKDKTAIAQQKELEVFYHALHFCNGRCANRELKSVIDREWNSAYEQWPQYRKYWYIGEPVIRETLKKWDWKEGGRVVQLEGDYAGAFVLMDMGRNAGRRLVPVKDLVDKFLFVPVVESVEAVVEDDGFGEDAAVVKRVDEVDDNFFAVEGLPVAAD